MNIFKRTDTKLLNSAEYESLSKKMVELFTAIEEMKVKIIVMEQNFANLRGNFNRKLKGALKDEEEMQKEEDLNKSVILPYHDKPFINKIGY